MEMIHVMIAFVIIMTMAVGTVALKLYMFPPIFRKFLVVLTISNPLNFYLMRCLTRGHEGMRRPPRLGDGVWSTC